MGIEIRITADSTNDLQTQLAMLLAGAAQTFIPVPGTQPEPHVEDKPTRRSRKTAEKVEPDEGNASTSSEESADPSSGTGSTQTEPGTQDQDNDEPQVQYADVQKAVTNLAAAKGRDAVVAVFAKFGVDHGTKLKPEQWVDALAELENAKEAA